MYLYVLILPALAVLIVSAVTVARLVFIKRRATQQKQAPPDDAAFSEEISAQEKENPS